MTNFKCPPASCACAFTRKAKGCMAFDAPMVSDPSSARRQSMAAGAPCGNDCRAAVPPDRSHDATSPIRSGVCMGDEFVYILELGSVLQEDDRRFGLLDLRPRFVPGDKARLAYRMYCACLSLFEGVAHHEQVAILLEFIGQESADRPGETDRGGIRPDRECLLNLKLGEDRFTRTAVACTNARSSIVVGARISEPKERAFSLPPRASCE